MDYPPSMMNVVRLILTTPLFETPPISVLSQTQSTCTFTMYTPPHSEQLVLLTHSFLVDHHRHVYMCKHPLLNQLLHLGSTTTTTTSAVSRQREQDYMIDLQRAYIELDRSCSTQLFLYARSRSSSMSMSTSTSITTTTSESYTPYRYLWQPFTLDDILRICSQELLDEQERVQHQWEVVWLRIRRMSMEPTSDSGDEDDAKPLPAP